MQEQKQDIPVIKNSRETEQVDKESAEEIFLLRTIDGRFQTRKKAQLITYKSVEEKIVKRVRWEIENKIQTNLF